MGKGLWFLGYRWDRRSAHSQGPGAAGCWAPHPGGRGLWPGPDLPVQVFVSVGGVGVAEEEAAGRTRCAPERAEAVEKLENCGPRCRGGVTRSFSSAIALQEGRQVSVAVQFS